MTGEFLLTGLFFKSPYLCTRLKEQDNTQSYNGSKKGV